MDCFVSPRAAAAMRRRDPVAAEVFLSTLGDLVPDLAARWGLSELAPLSGGAVSAVCSAVRADGSEVVLKVPFTAAVGAAEVAQLEAWSATRSPRRWPEVLESDPRSGAFVMSRLAGVPAHRRGAGFDGVFAAGVEEFLFAVAASSAPEGLPSPAELLVAPMFAAAQLLAAEGVLPGWRELFTTRHRDLGGLDSVPAVACHGDLWAGNVLVAASEPAVWVLDPAPTAAPVEFDVARVCADGWAGPGFERRAERLCASLGADRVLVERVAAVLVCAQVFTFARHGWDPAPIAAGVADVAATLGLDVEPLECPGGPVGR